MTSDAAATVVIEWRGRSIRVEYRWSFSAGADETPPGPVDGVGPLGPVDPLAPIVLLHEGLGSVAMWRDFPERLADATGRPVLAFSRPGYGCSTPRAAAERWQPDFMHRQAHELLPAVLDALGVGGPYLLFGHSDGASIALLHAARFGARVAGVVALAPHSFVEPVALAAIRATRDAYLTTDLRTRLARYHDDPDSAFWGWNDIWLDPAFAAWNIEAELATIAAPLLAIQGRGDEYGTLEQLGCIHRLLPAARVLELADSGHSPHRDQPEAVLAAARDFITTTC